MKNTTYKLAAGFAFVAVLFPFYIELAVGIIDPPGGPLLKMELGVLAVGVIGAIIARFRSHGMAWTLLATAFTQALVAVISLIVLPGHPASPPLEVLGVNGFFIMLFIGSALLFKRSASDCNDKEAEPTA